MICTVYWYTVLSGAEERVAEERPGWNFQIFKERAWLGI